MRFLLVAVCLFSALVSHAEDLARAQMLQSISNSAALVSGGNITLTQGSGGTATDSGDNSTAIYIPFIPYDNANNYTLSSVVVNLNTGAGNMKSQIYSSRTTTCPTGASACPNTTKCTETSSTAASTGNNTRTPTACGTFTNRTLYWVALNTDSGSLVYNKLANNVCAGTPFSVMFHAATYASAFPATTPSFGGAEQITDCFRVTITLTCVGPCGSAATPWIVMDHSDGTSAGTAVTAAHMNTSTHGGNGTWAIAGAGAINNITYQTSPSPQAFKNSAFSPVTQTSYNGSSPGYIIKRITGANDQAPNDNFNYTFASANAQVSAGFWFQTDTAQNLANTSVCDLFSLGAGNGSTMTFQLLGNGSALSMQMERVLPTTATFAGPAVASNTWVFMAGQWIPGTSGTAWEYDTTGAQVGSTVNLTGTSAGTIGNVSLGNSGSCFASPVQNLYYGGVKIDPTGASTATQLTEFFPDSPLEIGPALSAMVHEGIIPPATLRDGKWFSYALNRYLD